MEEGKRRGGCGDGDDDSCCSGSTNASKIAMVPEGHLPMYLADAFGELYEEDGMVVMARGLGSLLLLATFVRFYADTEEGHLALLQEEEEKAPNGGLKRPQLQKAPLVLVLSLNDNERKSLLMILQSWGTPPSMMPILITNESGQAKDRQALYARGGVFCITSRILITDLLTNVVTANEIAGMLVHRADQVTDESTEAFILRIFHSQKQPQCSGFVKGFSESPENLLSGFAKVDKVLKALRVRKLYLYPRFHESIRNELESTPPAVTEIHQPLSPLQKEIQHCIAAAVQACIRELKQTTTKLEWSNADLAIENCVTANFDKAISRQLEHEWHQLSPSTKQLVQDLRTLRTLFQSLLQYDCVCFWKLLQNIKSMSASSRHPSMWLLTSAADRLYRKAKERVYRIEFHQEQQQSTATTTNAKLVAVLEESPKWKLLRRVLDEVQKDYNTAKDRQQDQEGQESVEEGPCSVLVLVKDERTMETLKSYLTGGKKKTLAWMWLRYLEQQNDRSRAIITSSNKNNNTGSGGTSWDAVNGMAALSEERRLLLEEEGRTRRHLFGDTRNRATKKTGRQQPKRKLNEVPSYLKKRRRVATEKGRGDLVHQSTEDLEREAVLDDAMEEVERELDHDDKSSSDSSNEDHEPKNRQVIADRLKQSKERDEQVTQAMFEVTNPSELRVVIKSLTAIETGDHNSLLLLQDIRPNYVVFYDVDVAFIRAVEMYAALRTTSGEPLKTYFLVFEQSSEEKNFKKVLEKEKDAFERLIHHKKVMAPPMLHDTTQSQEMQQAAGSATSTYMNGTLPLAFDSRKGVGSKTLSKIRRDIAVDVREFRAALPSILHQGGMRLAPVTLTVGDFVLSNVHCVERKSISDLYGSFASGRLFTQAEAMCKHYKCPSLLIEFDPNKSFCLQNPNELGLDIKQDSACTKMSLLCMHFPALRILWSKNPHETLKLFQDLKRNHEEVNVDKAIEVGRNESLEALFQGPKTRGNSNSEGAAEGAGQEQNVQEEEEDEVNEVARDMLLRLPGVTVQAARRIMEQVDCLKDLADLPREQLRKIAGPVAGQKLFTFFRQQQQS